MRLTKETPVGFITFRGEEYYHIGPPPSGNIEPFQVYLDFAGKLDKSIYEMLDLTYNLDTEVIDIQNGKKLKHQSFQSDKLVRGAPAAFATCIQLD